MFILVVACEYPSQKYPVNGIFELDQAKALKDQGNKVVCAAVNISSFRRWKKWGIERKNVGNIDFYTINVPVWRVPLWLEKEIGVRVLSILYNVIVKDQGVPDVMHAHFTKIGYLASHLNKKFKLDIPVVMTEHFSGILNPNITTAFANTADYAYKNVDALIVVSHKLKDTIKEKFDVDSIYIPNIVDTNLFNLSSTDEKIPIFDFISVGRLISLKRMDLTIRAFIRAFETIDNVILTIFGDGSERRNLEKLIIKHGMQNRIKLMGLQPREAIAEQFRNGNCFVLASQSETFGVAYIEALASGLPVIATKCGGPESFIHEGNGFFVPVDDEDELVKAMTYMYNNQDKFDSNSISKEAIGLFSSSIIAKALNEVYKNVVAEKNRDKR